MLLLEVFRRFDRVAQFAHGDPRAPGIADYTARAGPICANLRVLHDDRLRYALLAVVENEADIHGVAVPDRDRRLQILEFSVPGPAERILPGIEIAEVFHHEYSSALSTRTHGTLVCKQGMAYQNELTTGAEIARKAGDLALKIRQGNIGVESKSDESPVTIADRECEKLIVAELQRAFPEDGLLGEEGASRESSNGRKWIIDPIDGTRDFIRGTRAWSVLIGLEERGKVTAGFAYFPSTGEMFSAARGEGAFQDGQRIKASGIRNKSDALLCCNGLGYMHHYPFAPDLLHWISEFWTVRSMGGCLDAMLVATGRADAWIEAQAKPWDLAPLKIIAEEAGCAAFDFDGNDTIYGGNYVICVPALADEIKRFVGARRE